MPFTFSHPALVLPVHAVFRRWTSLTGLVAGSLAPDFEKFIRMAADDPYSHTWRSIFYFNLPVGLLLTFLFHVIVRDALILNLPGFLSRRLERVKQVDWVGYVRQHYLVVILSVLLGAVSHISWDSFTHKGGRGARLLVSLSGHAVTSDSSDSFFFFMQLLSSLIGAVVVLAAILKLPPSGPLPHKRNALLYWLTVTAVAAAAVGLRLWLGEYMNRDLIFIYIAAVLIGLVAAPLILKRLRF